MFNRRSDRLFKKFIQENFIKTDDMVEFLKQKLKESENVPKDHTKKTRTDTMTRVNPVREILFINIYCTLIYYEWNFPSINDRLFKNIKFMNTTISKLHELINENGSEWGSKFAISFLNEIYKIKQKRFNEPVPILSRPYTVSNGILTFH